MEPSIAIQLGEWTLMTKSYSGQKIICEGQASLILEELHLCYGRGTAFDLLSCCGKLLHCFVPQLLHL